MSGIKQMNWKSVWKEWTSTTVAFGACLGAVCLNLRAWHVGNEANALGLLGCQFLRFLLLLVAGLAVYQLDLSVLFL